VYKLLISIVSHGQLDLVNDLLSDLEACNLERCIIVVRSNKSEATKISTQNLDCIHVKNLRPAGFSYNHNRNFEMVKSEYFAILNPDLKIIDPQIFQKLIDMAEKYNTDLVCPSVVDSDGNLEDNARKFPRILEVCKRLCSVKYRKNMHSSNKEIETVDWCAGMFHLYPSALFKNLKGLNEKYFLYCEDVEIGLRLKRRGFTTSICRDVFVEHDARRESHRKMKFLSYHLVSYIRLYFYLYLKIS